MNGFIFAATIDEEGALSLVLEGDDVVAPLEKRSFEAIRNLQIKKLIIVVSATKMAFHQVNLPWLPSKKARVALSFSLEEKLITPIENLHVAFDKEHHQDNTYLVSVCERPYLSELIELLKNHSLVPDIITADWFALNPGESAISPDAILISHEDYKGALSPTLAKLQTITEPCYVFEDSLPFQATNTTSIPLPFYVWVAKRLQETNPINLCQGPFRIKKTSNESNRWYQIAFLLSGIWLLLLIVGGLFKWIYLNHEVNVIDKKIAVIYRQFFPGSDTVIQPKFRMTHYLKTHDTRISNTFFQLLNGLEKALDLKTIQIETLRYHHEHLEVILLASHFSDLEALSETLKKSHITIRRMESSSVDGKAKSTMELGI